MLKKNKSLWVNKNDILFKGFRTLSYFVIFVTSLLMVRIGLNNGSRIKKPKILLKNNVSKYIFDL